MDRTSPYNPNRKSANPGSPRRTIQDVTAASSHSRPLARQVAKHISVTEPSGRDKPKPPLNAFMIDPKYLRPVGQPEQTALARLADKANRQRQSATISQQTMPARPVLMYSRLDAQEAQERVRRPRLSPAVAGPVAAGAHSGDSVIRSVRGQQERPDRSKFLLALTTLGAYLSGVLLAARNASSRLVDAIKIRKNKLFGERYSLTSGVAPGLLRRRSAKVLLPVFTVLLLLGLGIFNGIFDSTNTTTDTSRPEDAAVAPPPSNVVPGQDTNPTSPNGSSTGGVASPNQNNGQPGGSIGSSGTGAAPSTNTPGQSAPAAGVPQQSQSTQSQSTQLTTGGRGGAPDPGSTTGTDANAADTTSNVQTNATGGRGAAGSGGTTDTTNGLPDGSTDQTGTTANQNQPAK
jgi:hypothetical protein